MKKKLERLDRGILEGYNKNVLVLIARRCLPQDARNGGPPMLRRESYERWRYLVYRASKAVLIDALLPYVDESVLPSLKELQEKDILHNMKVKVSGRLTDVGRRAHQKYDREVLSPRKKATRHYMAEHPDLVAQVREKYGL